MFSQQQPSANRFFPLQGLLGHAGGDALITIASYYTSYTTEEPPDLFLPYR
jgi:hypothetical protein